MRCLLFLLIGCLACGGDRSPVAQAPHPSKTYWTVAEVVEPGTPLTEAMLVRAPAPWLASEAPPHLEMLVGRTPRHARLLPGEPIREKRLTRAGEAGIPGLVPQGMRAVTVPVTSVSGARPGLFADLYMGRGDEALYMPALAVLAVHPTADPDRLSTVTVSVTSLQAMDLVGVERASLGIRNPIDITYVDKHGARGTPALLGHGPEKVWVAVRDLYPGVLIAPEDVVEVGVSAQPAGLVEDPFGRIPFERILTGEPIRADRLSDPESGLGVEAVLPRGCHAVWIAVDSSQVQSLEPANHVDLLARAPGEASRVVAQGVFVLGIVPRTPVGQAEANLLVCGNEVREVFESLQTPGTQYVLGLRHNQDRGEADYGKDGPTIQVSQP